MSQGQSSDISSINIGNSAPPPLPPPDPVQPPPEHEQSAPDSQGSRPATNIEGGHIEQQAEVEIQLEAGRSIDVKEKNQFWKFSWLLLLQVLVQIYVLARGIIWSVQVNNWASFAVIVLVALLSILFTIKNLKKINQMGKIIELNRLDRQDLRVITIQKENCIKSIKNTIVMLSVVSALVIGQREIDLPDAIIGGAYAFLVCAINKYFQTPSDETEQHLKRLQQRAG